MVLQNGTFLGKVLLNNMIPVPLSQIQEISLNKHARFSNQEDNNYGLLLIKEARWIDEHKDSIIKKANWVYRYKINEKNRAYWSGRKVPGFLKATVDFKKVEEFMIQNYDGETLIEKSKLQSFVLK